MNYKLTFWLLPMPVYLFTRSDILEMELGSLTNAGYRDESVNYWKTNGERLRSSKLELWAPDILPER